jgi:hypothetical protein
MIKRDKVKEAERRKSVVLRNLAGEINNLQAAMELALCYRRYTEIKSNYKKSGDKAFFHGNTGRAPAIKKSEETCKRVVWLKKVYKYELANFTDFTERLNYEEGMKISVTTVAKILHAAGIASPRKHTIKRKKEHPRRPRMEYSGELLQADATPYDWLGDGHQYALHAFIDDATGNITGMYMTRNECFFGYAEVLRQTLTHYGLPMKLYPDKASVFFVNNKKKQTVQEQLEGKKPVTNFGGIIETLGIDMFPAHSPQAKGRVERLWETAQGRLPTEFRIHNIKTIDAANEYLEKKYISWFNRRFGSKPAKGNCFVKMKNLDILEDLLCASDRRRTDRGGQFNLKGYTIQCPDCIKQTITIKMSKKYGIYAIGQDGKKHDLKMIEGGSSSAVCPETTKDILDEYLLKDCKAKFRELYA